MPSLGGRRRSLEGDRWITYWVTYDDADDDSVCFVTVLSDERGTISTPDEVYSTSFDSDSLTAEEAVRQHICEFIDTNPLPPGDPPDPRWLNMRASGRLRLL